MNITHLNHQPATFHVRPITLADAHAMAGWRYPAPYDFYDWRDGEDPAGLLDAAAGMFAVDDEMGALAGFFCYGPAGQVPGGQTAGVYGEPLLDIGLGLRPDLTGNGLGLAFVQAGLAFGRRQVGPARFRLTVAAFNERAIRVYERAGFVRGERFESPVGGVPVSFLLMREKPGVVPAT